MTADNTNNITQEIQKPPTTSGNDTTAPAVADKNATTKPLDISKKTTGEKYYDIFQFTVGKAWIMVFTAALAYLARYGKEKYGPVPNIFKSVQEKFYDGLLNNKVFPMAHRGEFWTRLAGAAASTMAICHGGNLFAPILKWMENSREEISNYFNKHWGKPGEVEVAHERLKHLPKQSWGDVIKGRIGAWLLVFSSFLTLDRIIGKSEKSGMYYFDMYEEKFGRLVAGITRGGKEIMHTPLAQKLTKEQSTNKIYRTGKILALDFYATSAAIIIWTAISRLSAKKRYDKDHDEYASKIGQISGLELPPEFLDKDNDEKDGSSPLHSNVIGKAGTTRIIDEKTTLSHASAIDKQRQVTESEIAPAVVR